MSLIILFQNEYPRTSYNPIGMILLIFIGLTLGLASYYRIVSKLKEQRKNFMLGVKNDIINAISAYESIKDYSNDPNNLEKWRNQFGYIKKFINFNYKKVGLEKSYEQLVDKYVGYINE
jgi:hypothetical protein